MILKKYLLAAIVTLLALSQTVSAAIGNFTRIIPADNTVIVNQTSLFSSSWSTPLTLFLFVAIIGLLMLVFSILLKPEYPFDMIGYLAPVPLGFSTIMAFLGIDIRTSGGFSVIPNGALTTTTIIENHTIYTPWLLVILLGIFFGASLLNISRIQREKASGVIKAPE